jgi:hypothetical protein
MLGCESFSLVSETRLVSESSSLLFPNHSPGFLKHGLFLNQLPWFVWFPNKTRSLCLSPLWYQAARFWILQTRHEAHWSHISPMFALAPMSGFWFGLSRPRISSSLGDAPGWVKLVQSIALWSEQTAGAGKWSWNRNPWLSGLPC